MKTTKEEKDLKKVLIDLSKNYDGVLFLSLWPMPNSKGLRTIVTGPKNECRINEGRLGKFYNISEKFYDKMVEKYDSYYKNKTSTKTTLKESVQKETLNILDERIDDEIALMKDNYPAILISAEVLLNYRKKNDKK